MRRLALTAMTAALLAVPATASAHPSFNPNQLVPGETAEANLVVPHGCAAGGGMPMGDEGEASPTVELALEQTEGITIEPGDVDGWDVTDDGEAWVWTDAGGATTEVITFPVSITLDEGASGDVWLRAFQECENGESFQWVATPDEDATWPAVHVTAGDEVGTAAAPEGVGQSMDMEMGEDGEMDVSDDDMDDMDDEMADGDMAMEGEEAADEAGLSTALLVVLGAIALGGIAAVVIRQRAS